MKHVLITGGAGYFGEVLARRCLARGDRVRIFDLNRADIDIEGVEQVQGDIRDPTVVRRACEQVDIVQHNVAQVPLAKDKHAFWSVNYEGTRILLESARDAGVRKIVYTSSSAVFGAPRDGLVTRATLPAPAEEYGRAKLAGEELCRAAAKRGIDVSIVRPRTILGHGRLGIFQILFEWVFQGKDVPVFNGGHNRYQFVHADDLADACIAAAERPGLGVYNVGAGSVGTIRELLEALISHAGSASRIKSLPMRPMEMAMGIASRLGLSPLGPYHALMYGRELYFDISDAQRELGYAPRYTSEAAICESYDWYLANRHRLKREGASQHKSVLKKRLMSITPYLLRVIPT